MIFLKRTDFNDCLSLKINNTTTIFDEYKKVIEKIENYSYGNFIIELDGLWLNEDNIWFQWNLLQAKIKTPTYLSEYSFIDEIHEKVNHKKEEDKYDKMLKMGVPKEVVNRQNDADGKGILPSIIFCLFTASLGTPIFNILSYLSSFLGITFSCISSINEYSLKYVGVLIFACNKFH